MFKIIPFLFIATAYAIDPAPDCDVNELKRRCFVSVCQGRQSRVPSTLPELERALREANFQMPADRSKQVDEFVGALVDLNRRSTSLVQTRGYDGIAEDVLSQLDANFQGIYSFFREDIPIIQREDGNIEFVVNDLSVDPALSQRMGNFLKNYFELFLGITRARDRVNLPGAKDYYLGLLNDVERYFTSVRSPKLTDLRARKLMLNSNSTAAEIASAVMPQLAQEDVRGLFRMKFIGVKNDLTQYLRLRAEADSQRPSKQLTVAPLRESILRSCALSHYMISTVSRNMTPDRAFGDAKRAAVRGFHEKFLVKLSDHSRRILGDALTDDVFVPIRYDENVYPEWPAMTNALRPFASQMSPSTYLLQNEVFMNSKQFVCSIDSYLPEDRYQEGKISTSLFAIAAGHPDILAHELGHWVSDKMTSPEMSETSRAKFTGLRDCLGTFYEGDPTRVEEDFADWFMNTTTTATGIGCSFDTIVPMLAGYLLNQPNLPEEDKYLPLGGDPHSGSLFRELHGKMIRGDNLSLECRQLIQQYPAARPKACSL